MPKKPNITGLCPPAKHYMADISQKLARVLVKGYLVIFDPRRPVETIQESSRWAQEWIEVEGKRVFTVRV